MHLPERLTIGTSSMAPSRLRAPRAQCRGRPPCWTSGDFALAAAGQDVGACAGAPRAGPLRCLELAAADFGTAPLALIEAGDLHTLGRFAFARHGTSLLSALREVEFFAFGLPLRRLQHFGVNRKLAAKSRSALASCRRCRPAFVLWISPRRASTSDYRSRASQVAVAPPRRAPRLYSGSHGALVDRAPRSA